MMYRPVRRAFTLVELLVAVAIVAILFALILPAAQRSREAARRIHCANNLKNMGIALHEHVSITNAFPAGFGQPVGESFLVRLLPLMDQTALFNSINIDNPPLNSVFCSENGTAFVTKVSSFMCPSDLDRSGPMTEASSNYAANAGSHAISGDGAFIGRPLSPRAITDGLSQTVAVSEWVIGSGDETHPTRLGSVYKVDNNASSFERFRHDCINFIRVEATSTGSKGQFWVAGALGSTQYNHTLPPNVPSCFNLYFRGYTAGSYHGGGANALTLDGGVHFVRDSIDPRVWSALGTRSNGEIISSDATGW